MKKILTSIISFILVTNILLICTSCNSKSRNSKNISEDRFALENGNIIYLGKNGVEETEIIIPNEIDGTIIEEISSIDCRQYVQEGDITKIVFPETVKSLYLSLIDYYNLVEFEIPDNNLYFCSIDGAIYSKNKNKLYRVPPAKKEYTIPEFVTEISEGALLSWRGTELFIPSNVQNLDEIYFPSSSDLTITLDNSFANNIELLNNNNFNDKITVICNGEVIKAPQETTTTTTQNIETQNSINTNLLINLNLKNMKINDFINNWNIIVPEIFKNEITSAGLDVNKLKLSHIKTQEYNSPSDPSYNKFAESFTVYGYTFCEDLFYVRIQTQPNQNNIISSVSIAFYYDSKNIAPNVKEKILSDNKLTANLLSSSFAVCKNIYNRDELHTFGVRVFNGISTEDILGNYYTIYENGIGYRLFSYDQSLVFIE